MSELKPCPFCGGKAEFVVKGNISNHCGVAFTYVIACSKCKCTPMSKSSEMHIYLDKNGEIKMTGASDVTKQCMIDEWNTRVNEKGDAE